MQERELYVSLGSNLGDRERNIRQAVRLMEGRVGRLIRLSSMVETEPWGFASQHPFINAAACFMTELPVMEILNITKDIERELGRTVKSGRTADGRAVYHDRTIDIDILLCGDERVTTPELTVPHPHMEERDFVMIPLKEIRKTAENE